MNFEAFFKDWLIRQENLSYQLLDAIAPENIHNNELHQCLIDQVLSHYQQYYLEKSLAATEDVFQIISPPWLTFPERTFLWIGGFRPSLIFKLIANSVQDLTVEQEREVQQVKAETRREERELGQTMARVQESVASAPFMNLARRSANLVDGEVPEAEAAMKELQKGMLAVLEAADALRSTAAWKVLQILLPIQTVKFLAAVAQFHLKTRRWCLDRDQGLCAIRQPLFIFFLG